MELHSIDQSQASTLEFPRGLYVTSEPDVTIGYERAASEVCIHMGDFIRMYGAKFSYNFHGLAVTKMLQKHSLIRGFIVYLIILLQNNRP